MQKLQSQSVNDSFSGEGELLHPAQSKNSLGSELCEGFCTLLLMAEMIAACTTGIRSTRRRTLSISEEIKYRV